ncbi:hypothetical protein BH20ACT5_BH20ACT5_13870 [soil metagenome]
MTEMSPYRIDPPVRTTLAAVPDRATGVRASDAEREQVARILRAAAGEGMLSLNEADERLAALYASRFRSDLAPLTADLPDGGRSLLENTVEARSAARAGLRRHLLTVVVVAALLVTVWVLSDADFFWPAWPLAFMGLSVLGHARRIGYSGPYSPTSRPVRGR